MKVYHKILSLVLVPLLVFSVVLYGPIAYASSAVSDAVFGWLTDQALDNLMQELYGSALGVMVSQDSLDYEWARRQAAYQDVLSDLQNQFDFANNSLSDFETFWATYTPGSGVTAAHKKTIWPYINRCTMNGSQNVDTGERLTSMADIWYYCAKNNVTNFKDFQKLIFGGYEGDEIRDKVENNQDTRHPARITSQAAEMTLASHVADAEDNWTTKWVKSVNVNDIKPSELGGSLAAKNALVSFVEDASEAGYDFVWCMNSTYTANGSTDFKLHAFDSKDGFVNSDRDLYSSTTGNKIPYVKYFPGSVDSFNYSNWDGTFSDYITGQSYGVQNAAPLYQDEWFEYLKNTVRGVFSTNGAFYLVYKDRNTFLDSVSGFPSEYRTTDTTFDPTSGQDYTYNYDTISSNSYVSSYEYIQNIVEGDTYINGITNEELMALIAAIMTNWNQISEGDQDLEINRIEHVETDETTGTTNTWYSYEYNYITNNYGGEGEGGNGSGEGNGSGSGSGSGSGAWSAIADVFRGFGDAIGGLITGLVSMLTGIIGSIGSALHSVTDFTAVSSFMSGAFSFIPAPIWALVFSGIAACVVISIFKALK